jgi:uncharacterized membrane protein YfcA
MGEAPRVSLHDAALLAGGGLVAGVFNTLAGGGSLLSVPLLVLVGLPGTLANGTNRVGVLAQNAVAAWRFRAQGVSGFRRALPLLPPIAMGSALGAFVISQVADRTFEKLFGVLMVLLLIPILWRPAAGKRRDRRPWSAATTFAVFLGIGLYGGAFQAGVGIALVLALSYAGYDLVVANSIKVVVNAILTCVAIPVFFAQGEIAWLPGLLLAAGYGLGGEVGARLAVRGGERIIRPVLAVSVIALAGRMIGLYH